MRDETVLVPEILLSDKEIENIITNKFYCKKTRSKVLNCNVLHIKDSVLPKVLLSDVGGQNRAVALRITSKALSIKRSTPEAKLAMLAIAGGLLSSYPVEADRICRAV